MRRTGWLPFALWALPGIVLGFQVSAIGVLLLPLGLVATLLMARLTRVWPEALGLLEGVAAVCFVVVVANADYWSCPAGGQVITRTRTSVAVESCGGLNPWPWLIVGLLCAVGAPLAYALARRGRPGGEAPAPG